MGDERDGRDEGVYTLTRAEFEMVQQLKRDKEELEHANGERARAQQQHTRARPMAGSPAARAAWPGELELGLQSAREGAKAAKHKHAEERRALSRELDACVSRNVPGMTWRKDGHVHARAVQVEGAV